MPNDSIKYSLLAAADNANSLLEIEQEFIKQISYLKQIIFNTDESDKRTLQELKQKLLKLQIAYIKSIKDILDSSSTLTSTKDHDD